jgi:hypothetical protein
MLTSDLSITIHVTQEAIELICATVGFLAMCWVGVKALAALPKKEPNATPQQPTPIQHPKL